MTVATLFPTIPPTIDGIGDYTALQATHLADLGIDTTILTAQSEWTPLPGVRVERAFPGGGRSIMEAATTVTEMSPDWLLVQYNPLSYSGRFSMNPYLSRLLARVKAESSRTRIGLVLHEAYARFEHFSLAPVWQRLQLYMMGRHADLIVSAASTWCTSVKRWLPHARVAHLPVGSNVPHVGLSRLEARDRLGLSGDTRVLGFFGSLGYGRRLDHVRAALRANSTSDAPVTLLYAGGDGDTLRRLAEEQDHTGPLHDLGKCPHEQVSTALSAMDVFVAPYRDGVSTRRGSFMAALQHGLPTVTTLGASTDEVLRRHNGDAFLAVEESSPDTFGTKVRDLLATPDSHPALRKQATTLYADSFDWPVTTGRLRDLLTE